MKPNTPFLPISAVIPVYQCAERLTDHILMIRGLRSALGQVIWVCTPSKDGSHHTARQEATSQNDIYLEVAAGLYQAWNKGIAQASCPMTYVSTVGESISLEGLQEMLACITKFRASLVFTPPKIEPSTKETIQRTRHWPVFEFSYLLRFYHRQIIPAPILARLQLLAGISCVLGSFASCLCDTNFMKARPFPCDFNHYGDTAWFYLNLTEARVAYLHKVFTTFHVHDLSQRHIAAEDLPRCLKFFTLSYARQYPANELLSWAATLGMSRARLDFYRKPHPYRFWWLNPIAWVWRFARTWTLHIIYAELLWQIFLGFVAKKMPPSFGKKEC